MQSFSNTGVQIKVPCDSTTTGDCPVARSAEDCMRLCQPPHCYWGTYSARTQKCTPVLYNSHRDLNPGFVFQPEEGTTTFVDTNFFRIPAERNDRMFFYDKVRIQNVETGIVLKPDLMLRPVTPYLPIPGMDFIPITARTPVLLYDRQLDSVLRVEGGNVNWYKAVDFLHQDYEAFFLETEEKESPTYSSTFRIRSAINEYISLPPMTSFFEPRVNDLIVSLPTINLPRTFRFLYIPPTPRVK